MREPRFTHDCDTCEFLGSWYGPAHEGEEPKHFDLYVHTGSVEITVVARFSDDGPDYHSGLCFAESKSVLPLVEAKQRAEARGVDFRAAKQEQYVKSLKSAMQTRNIYTDEARVLNAIDQIDTALLFLSVDNMLGIIEVMKDNGHEQAVCDAFEQLYYALKVQDAHR